MTFRSSRRLAVGVAAMFVLQLVAGVAPQPTYARVDPLTIIKRQIHKPNMLVVLDTSGSLTGVPGGSFDNSDEVGVDCDNGADCRGGLSQGTCASSGKACFTDDHCRTTTCASGAAACTIDSDCQPIAGKCTTGENCYADLDCPARTTGRCANSGYTCSPSRPCSPTLRCLYGNNSCAVTSDCATGVCGTTTTGCRSDSDCPFVTSGGTCAYGTTPTGGCANASQCPTRPKVCSDDPTKTCTTVNTCGGTCKRAGNSCTSNNDCRTRSNDSCDFTGKTCASPANSCVLPRLTCNIQHADNVCRDINTCTPDANICTGEGANRCAAGVPGDLCNASSTTTGSRMCRLAQTKCYRDSDCSSISGDRCGPASSRFVIAKRVIRNIVNANANVLNLGLMTFYQNRYFPYYRVTGATMTTRTLLLTERKLTEVSCYTPAAGPSATCTIDGTLYTRQGTTNSQYQINQESGTANVDTNFCGPSCSIAGVGTGLYKGTYYTYSYPTGGSATLVQMTSYRGKTFTEGGSIYRYYDSRPDYYNGGATPPIDTVSCGSSCSASCGGRWDTQLAPFLTTDDSAANVNAMIGAFNQAMEPASYGGLISYNGTPSGCTLDNSGSPDRNHSAYHYMQAVKSADTLTCRQNYVLFITDGEANGPGDTSCTASACSAADPVASGCTCKAVLAAYRMRKDLGVKTFVIGFSIDASGGNGRVINDNIAKAGGTDQGEDGVAPFSFGAASEAQLSTAIQGAIYQAVKGSYGTAPASASQGGQAGASLRGGALVIDSRADFPSWKGHLVAYDVTGQMPQLVWDAATALESMDWKTRRIYTSDSQNNLVKWEVDQGSGAITNARRLYELGLGASAEEAALIARFAMGDPVMKNPAILGSIINSTPIDVAAPPDGSLPGAHEFYLANRERPSLIYVGSDDGMLHAFYTRATNVGGVTKPAGSEAFAYVPPSMLPIISTIYAQGGQVADPSQHIYGLATSPKVKNVCVANCTTREATWQTVLVMSQGWGGNEMFALDITNPFSGSTPFTVKWSTRFHEQASLYSERLGLAVSVPAFTFKRSESLDDHRIMMTSAYPIAGGASTQGHFVLSVRASTGNVVGQVQVPVSGSCAQEYAMVADISTSRQQVPSDNGAVEGRKELIAGYIGDTWGNLWQYDKDGGLTLLASFGCQHPLHHSPTVVQLDQDDPFNPHAGDIYLVQVTNSTTDRTTENYPGSRIIVIKQRMVEGRPTIDTTFGNNGQVVLTAGNSQQLCAVSDMTGQTCLTPLAANARPLGTPLALPKTDGAGFTIISNWYQPATSGCGKGATYFVMHDIAGATVALRQAVKIADEPVVSPIVAGGRLMVTGSSGPINVGGAVTTNVTNATAPPSMLGDLFRNGGWSEVE